MVNAVTRWFKTAVTRWETRNSVVLVTCYVYGDAC